MKKLLFVSVAIVALMTVTGCTRKNCVEGIKCGLVERSSAAASIAAYVEDVNTAIEKGGGKKGELITVGHQIGNYEDYPKFPGCIKDKGFIASERMETGFSDYRLSAVEIDVQLGPDGNTVYIMHERLTDRYSTGDSKWNEVMEFYNKNTLRSLLDVFVRTNDKYLYIELKAKKADTADESEKRTVLKMLEVITASIPKGVNPDSIRSRIGFISFNYELLDYVIKQKKEKNMYAKHRLYYIACSDSLIGRAVTCFCPELNNPDNFLSAEREGSKVPDLWNLVNNSDDIAGIWLSPGDIKDVVSRLSRLNEKRVNNKRNPLEFFLSTYQKRRESFFSLLNDEKALNGNSAFYGNIRGLVFDIKK